MVFILLVIGNSWRVFVDQVCGSSTVMGLGVGLGKIAWSRACSKPQLFRTHRDLVPGAGFLGPRVVTLLLSGLELMMHFNICIPSIFSILLQVLGFILLISVYSLGLLGNVFRELLLACL